VQVEGLTAMVFTGVLSYEWTSEKRKVDSSILSLTTRLHLRKRSDQEQDSGVFASIRLSFRPKAERTVSGFSRTGSSRGPVDSQH
jgi:hypothetical protein